MLWETEHSHDHTTVTGPELVVADVLPDVQPGSCVAAEERTEMSRHRRETCNPSSWQSRDARRSVSVSLEDDPKSDTPSLATDSGPCRLATHARARDQITQPRSQAASQTDAEPLFRASRSQWARARMIPEFKTSSNRLCIMIMYRSPGPLGGRQVGALAPNLGPDLGTFFSPCGELVGASEQGCGPVTPVEDASWTSIKELYR